LDIDFSPVHLFEIIGFAFLVRVPERPFSTRSTAL
jgi:hypothetical protein